MATSDIGWNAIKWRKAAEEVCELHKQIKEAHQKEIDAIDNRYIPLLKDTLGMCERLVSVYRFYDGIDKGRSRLIDKLLEVKA